MKRLIYKLFNGYSPFRYSFQVSISNVCDQSCDMCAVHSKVVRSNPTKDSIKGMVKYMEFLDFYCFLQGLNRFRVKHVTIAGKGEPLLNRDIIYFCNALEERRIHFTITTNGTHLADFIDDLDGFKYLDTIRVSVVDESNLWMISYFLHHKKVRFHVYPKVNETTKIKQAKTFSVNGYEGDLPYGFNKIKHCYVPFNFFIVNTDGTVNPCCECNVSVGNAFMAPFWNLKPFRTFRKKALDMKHLTNCDCPNCGHHAKF